LIECFVSRNTNESGRTFLWSRRTKASSIVVGDEKVLDDLSGSVKRVILVEVGRISGIGGVDIESRESILKWSGCS